MYTDLSDEYLTKPCVLSEMMKTDLWGSLRLKASTTLL